MITYVNTLTNAAIFSPSDTACLTKVLTQFCYRHIGKFYTELQITGTQRDFLDNIIRITTISKMVIKPSVTIQLVRTDR